MRLAQIARRPSRPASSRCGGRRARLPRPARARACRSSSTAWRRQSASRCAPLDLGAMGSRPPPRRSRRVAHRRCDRGGLRRRARRRRRAGARWVAGVDQRAVVVLAVDLDQRARRGSRSTCTLTGWSLTKARVRPSASCTRRRISVVLGVDVVVGEQRPRRVVARRGRTPPSPGPAPRRGAPARRRRARRAPARRRRAGSTCRRRSRRSARRGPRAKSMSSRSIRTMSRIESWASMAASGLRGRPGPQVRASRQQTHHQRRDGRDKRRRAITVA